MISPFLFFQLSLATLGVCLKPVWSSDCAYLLPYDYVLATLLCSQSSAVTLANVMLWQLTALIYKTNIQDVINWKYPIKAFLENRGFLAPLHFYSVWIGEIVIKSQNSSSTSSNNTKKTISILFNYTALQRPFKWDVDSLTWTLWYCWSFDSPKTFYTFCLYS